MVPKNRLLGPALVMREDFVVRYDVWVVSTQAVRNLVTAEASVAEEARI